jgi:hypothetical protein
VIAAPTLVAADTDHFASFRDELLAAGMFLTTGIDGLFLRSEAFERIVRGIDAIVHRTGGIDAPHTYHFPLVIPRGLLDETDYVRSFPQLTGVVFAPQLSGHHERVEIGEPVDGPQDERIFEETDLALCPAACHPLYPTQRGDLPEGGRTFEIYGQCFRHEPSVDPARMQAFRQHEIVYLGSESGARSHRDLWVERALEIHTRLGLAVSAVTANDPFFGRAGQLLAANQLDDALKIEIVASIASPGRPTAITSANLHLDHFGRNFGISTADGEVAHTACVGFGVERIALALIRSHGLDQSTWPSSIRTSSDCETLLVHAAPNTFARDTMRPTLTPLPVTLFPAHFPGRA